MKIKNMILTSVLLAMGFVLHSVVPGFFGMKFDLLLTFMFIAIAINPTFKNALLSGCLSGIITAMTTTFPGGQLPNLIDKVITALIVFYLIKAIKTGVIQMGIIGFIGTFVSGIIFLSTALVIVGLPAPIGVLIMTIVMPTAIANTIITVAVFKAAQMAIKPQNSLT
jgi:hypothetical protein